MTSDELSKENIIASPERKCNISGIQEKSFIKIQSEIDVEEYELRQKLLDSKIARKKTEESVKLLMNRISLLKNEEEKARKTLENTRKRVEEIKKMRQKNIEMQKKREEVLLFFFEKKQRQKIKEANQTKKKTIEYEIKEQLKQVKENISRGSNTEKRKSSQSYKRSIEEKIKEQQDLEDLEKMLETNYITKEIKNNQQEK